MAKRYDGVQSRKQKAMAVHRMTKDWSVRQWDEAKDLRHVKYRADGTNARHTADVGF